MNNETLLKLNVGDVIEIDGLLLGLSDEKMLLVTGWIVGKNAGREKTIEFSMKYFGVYVGTATCRVTSDKAVWTMGGAR